MPVDLNLTLIEPLLLRCSVILMRRVLPYDCIVDDDVPYHEIAILLVPTSLPYLVVSPILIGPMVRLVHVFTRDLRHVHHLSSQVLLMVLDHLLPHTVGIQVLVTEEVFIFLLLLAIEFNYLL